MVAGAEAESNGFTVALLKALEAAVAFELLKSPEGALANRLGAAEAAVEADRPEKRLLAAEAGAATDPVLPMPVDAADVAPKLPKGLDEGACVVGAPRLNQRGIRLGGLGNDSVHCKRRIGWLEVLALGRAT